MAVTKKTEEKKLTAPAKAEVKPAAKVEAKPAAKTEAKPAAKVEAKPVVKTEAKPAAKVEVKAEVKKPVKAEAKKPVAKKAPAKKAPAKKAEVKANVVVEYYGKQVVTKDIVAACEKAYKAENKAAIKTIDVYVKPEDNAAYYVVNSKVAGKVEL